MSAPNTIYLSTEDAELFGQKYGHPFIDWVEPEQECVTYLNRDTLLAELEALKKDRDGNDTTDAWNAGVMAAAELIREKLETENGN